MKNWAGHHNAIVLQDLLSCLNSPIVMESDSSDDEQYDTSDNSESDDQVNQMSFHNELNSSSESSDEVSGQESIRGIFKFGKLTSSSKVSEKENEEFHLGKAKEENSSEGDEDVNLQTLELPSDQSEETVLHSSVTDNSAKVVGWTPGRDSTDGTEEIDSIDSRDDSNMKADEKVDTTDTLEEKETLRENMNSSHMSPSYMSGLEGNADESFQQRANDTDKTYQIDDSLSIMESFVILNSEPTSALSFVVNDQMGEIEQSFQEATQIPSLEGFEQSFEICDESGSIYENIENMKVISPNSKDTIITPLSIHGKSTKDTIMDMSQPSPAEVHEEKVKKRPPPVAPKPSKEKQKLNGSQVQSILIMEDLAPNKTAEEQCFKETEQKPVIRQPFEIKDSAQESSQLEMEMVDIVKEEKNESVAEGNSLPMESFSIVASEENVASKIDDEKQISEGCIQSDDEETADAEKRHKKDAKIDAIEHNSQYEKEICDSVQQPLIESHVYDTKQSLQEDDTEERPLNDTKIATVEKNPQDSKDNAEERPQKEIQLQYAEQENSSKKVSDMLKIFESNPVEDTTGKDAHGELYNIKSFQGENEPMTRVPELPPVPKRRGNIVLKPNKQPTAEPKPVKKFNSEESQLEQSEVPELSLPHETQKDDNNESKSPNEIKVTLPPLTQKNQVTAESVKPENPEDGDSQYSGPPTPPPKGIAVMESLKHIKLERESLESLELTRPPTPPPKSLVLMKTYKPEAQPCVTSEATVAQPPPLPPKRFLDQSTSKSPQSMHSSSTGQLHDQQGPDLPNWQERPSLQTLHLQEDMSGAQSSSGHWTRQGSEGGMQMPSLLDGQQNLIHGTYCQPNWSTGDSGHPARQPVYPVQQPYGPWRPPPMPHGPHSQYWQPWMGFYPGYGHQFPPGMQQGHFPSMNSGRSLYRPPFVSSQEPPSGQTYKTVENQNQHLQEEHKQQQHQQKQQMHQHHQQQQQPRSQIPEGKASGQDKHAEPDKKQEERQKEKNKEMKKEKVEPVKTTVKPSKISKTSGTSKVSTDEENNEYATSKRDKEKKDVTSPKRTSQDVVRSSPQPAMRKEEHRQEKEAKDAHTKSEKIPSKPGYTMVIGLSENTSHDNLLNFMEGKSGSDVKEIVYGPRRENAVVIFEKKPDCVHFQEKVSKKKLDGRVLEVFDMPPPTSIILSTKDPKEFSTDTLTFHFESKKYGGAELVEDGIKITEDGCYIMTFTDSDSIERVCAIQHNVENIPLNVSPYYQFKKWMAWNTAIHGINIPEPFSCEVDPVLVGYLQSFPRAMKSVQMAMMEMHAGIELQADTVLVTCLITPEVKGCRKLVTSWRKDAKEKWDKFLSSTFRIEKISIMSDIWKDCMNIVKALIKGKEVMLVEKEIQHYIQLVGFDDEVKTTYEEVMEKKKKLERIRSIGTETMSLKSAAKKRLLDRDGIFQRLITQFSDFDVYFEQSSEEIVLSGVPEDRSIAKLQIYEELRKFDEPFVIQDSTGHFSQFIKEGAPRKYIIKEFDKNSLIVDWDVNIENGHVSVYCIPAHSGQHVANEMKKMVRESNIPLSHAEQCFVTSEEWMMYQAEAGSKCDGLVHIVVNNDLKNVIWISMDGLYADILDDLKDFIKKNTVLEEMIQCDPVIRKFMQVFWKQEDYKEIEKNSRDKHLQLTWQGDRLMVKGTVEGIKNAKELWKEKTCKIISKTHTLKRIGIKEVLMSEEQKGTFEDLKREHRCLIQTENLDLPSRKGISRDAEMDEGDRIYDTINESLILETHRRGPYTCQNGLTISLTKGQLAEQKVDVIVCATSPDLNLNSGAASKSLLQRGGQSLQDECKINHAEKIQEGDVVDISGGELLCAKVYLTALPDWRKSNDGQTLRDVVIHCLEKAHKDSKTSIAFAAMGTGQLHYPHHDVARLMYDACISYDNKNPKSSVKKVHFVLFEKDNDSIRAFEKEEKDMLCGGVRPRSLAPAPKEYLVGNVKISQTVEELANQQVDAILCSCAENLVLSQSGACAALLCVGGQTLQDECKVNYPNGIKHGQIAIIGGGNLKCKHVFLTTLPKYDDNGEKALFDVITEALKLATKRGCKSIAMPAMGSGYLRYPAALVAKVMYDAVGDWAKKNTSSSLTTVKFILFFKDKSTQDAFQDQLRVTHPRTNTRKQRSINVHLVKTLPGSGSCIIIDPNNDSVCTVGKMKVKVYTGDILNETTDAIVNSVGADFSFQGGVSTLLKQKCPVLEKKCQDKAEELYESGVVMTDSFGLKCKKIIHVKFQDTLTGWKRVIEKCLKKASKNKLSSIAFPVLGTGGGYILFAADKIAEMFFEALINFDEGGKNHQLQHVNIVVYHRQPQFIPAIKKGMVKVSRKGPRGMFGRTWDKFIDFGRDVKDIFLPTSGLEYRQASTFSRSQMSQVRIQVYSDSELNITCCITNLEMKLNTVYTSTPLNDDLIAKMSPQEVEEFFKTDLLVECKFKQEEKQILILGTQQNVSRAQHEFHGKLRDRARKESEKKEAEQLCQIVQWHYEEVTAEEIKLTPYDDLINLRMEKAFKNGNRFLELPDSSNDTVYIIDFKNYVEYVSGDEDDSVKIVRKDILKARVGALPEAWDEMQDKENLKRVNMLNLSPEYQQLENIFLTEAKTGPYSNRVPNVQNIKVVKIERIQNKTLYQQYSAKKKLIETKYKGKPNVTIERKVWHGTPYDSVDGICTHGFNRSYCGKNGVWFGHGVYFATNASYSARGWLAAGNQAPPPGTKQYIFYVSVCVGEYVQGNKDMRVLPAKDKSKPTDTYDSAVNNVNNVEEIVIFNDTQAYPDYLITFTT
ncbi:hypothetical protein CHS0354_006160 [Potamilus streckersoni]|uniref:Poly [ADP-ribose] polymerase n=1 Tax=Potamilus streckersoni TaxID=2493646 RepID=A0AAE0STL5_9BIVA|nr:hypothetical protein CHS0354_006160 [Potamilus streckersoni]